MNAPTITVAIANYNGGRFLADAVVSALSQEGADLEVVVVDDASTDNSIEIAEALARRDGRVRVEALKWNRGPGGARNRAFELARGEWFAVLDGDDLMHPQRLSRLLSEARRTEADIVADDLLLFRQDRLDLASAFLEGRRAAGPSWLTAEELLDEGHMFGRTPNLGYLKPMIRMDAWRAARVRYDETLSIGEDYDFLLKLLACGLTCRIRPDLGYFYRKHAQSTSHRLAGDALSRMLEADDRFRDWIGKPEPRLQTALDRRRTSITRAQAFTTSIEALKARRPALAFAALARDPAAALLYRMPLAAAVSRALRYAALDADHRRRAPGPRLCVISRQRLVGRTNGSSNYLLDIARSAKDAGFALDLVQPSPSLMGRWPVMRLRKEMGLFDTISLRGVWRVGPLVVARDPAIYLAALRGVAAKILERLTLSSRWLDARPAPYSVAAPWTRDDHLFVARHARGAEVLLADYAWQTEAFPYAITPTARTAVLMHDLFHARADLFRKQRVADSVASLDRHQEAALLARADALLAIQGEEALKTQTLAPRSQVILAQMSADPRGEPQIGNDKELLFVASNAAPNVLGVSWFLEAVWPRIRAAVPDAELRIAGNVSRMLGPPPSGVRYLGVVADLGDCYATAGVVISPLTTGSGLKIKLIEALAQGKACVVTGVTLQGVERTLGEAVIRADDANGFADAVLRLMSDRSARGRLAGKALRAVTAHFSRDAAHRDFRDWLSGSLNPPKPSAYRESAGGAK